MIAYILKMTICASLLLTIYYFLLEKEKMHTVKRFYLLFSIVFSMTIPFASIRVTGNSFLTTLPFTSVKQTSGIAPISINEVVPQETYGTISLTDILFVIYIIVCAVLLLRFVSNIIGLLKLARESEQINIDGAKIVLTKKSLVPYSFAHYIFLNNDEYMKGMTENEVLTHEMAHIKQYHSIDIVFLELLLAFFWFNPILYVYKNRIKLNHEFLADEAVICAYNNTPQYQQILIDKISRQTSLSIVSSFNYLLTKKRLTMMTKTTSRCIAVSKTIIMLPLFLIFTFTFCTKKAAGEQAKAIEDEVQIVKEEKADIATNSANGATYSVKPSSTASKETVKFTPPTVVEDKDKKTPPPPPIKNRIDEPYGGGKNKKTGSKPDLDLSSYKIGDKYIDNDRHEWEVISIHPPKLKTLPPNK